MFAQSRSSGLSSPRVAASGDVNAEVTLYFAEPIDSEAGTLVYWNVCCV